MKTTRRDIAGQRFGMLVAKEFHSIIRRGAAWTCVCDCGNSIVAKTESLVRGYRKTCGCSTNKIKFRTHGKSKTPEYVIWQLMLRRCRHPATAAEQRDYYGRGIKVCERWSDFANFIADMGQRPIGGQIERIDNDGNYEPSNCRWATSKEQARNKRTSRFLEHDGRRLCVADWAATIGINQMTLWKRIDAGWSTNKALTQPVRTKERMEQC